MFEYVVFVLIIKKLNNEFKVYVNYQTLNIFTIKNRNILLLIKNILVKLYFVKYYNKFNIITVFNEIKIREKNKKKLRFLLNIIFSSTLLCYSNYTTYRKFFSYLLTLHYTSILTIFALTTQTIFLYTLKHAKNT